MELVGGTTRAKGTLNGTVRRVLRDGGGMPIRRATTTGPTTQAHTTPGPTYYGQGYNSGPSTTFTLPPVAYPDR
jgi:hypothetical protein